jgi:hypothetical protein
MATAAQQENIVFTTLASDGQKEVSSIGLG